VVAASLDGNQGVLNGEETEGSNGGGVNLVLHYALKVRIEEGRHGRWGETTGGGAGCDAGEGSQRWEEELTGGPHLSASERKRKGEEGELGRQLGLMGHAG
jgi:hypothetical protein